MSKTWELQKGNILVVEDANTASLVIVVKDLKKKEDKIVALEEIIKKMRND
jgi:histidyl-tRNA synthetase